MLVIGHNADAKLMSTTSIYKRGWSNDSVTWFIGTSPSIHIIFSRTDTKSLSLEDLAYGHDSTEVYTCLENPN
jgi:hypothetical protein